MLLTLAAVAGALCLVLVVAAGVFQVGIVLFRTGSMGPTIPAGSAALVREVPASSLAVGDVVTVDRPGRLPVTHRIVAIDDGSGPELRRLTLRGDANPV
ncbi:MAG TPA: S26 family signal peptidase, partial [Agromyces sp.]